MLGLERILERYGIVAASLEPPGDTQNANHVVAAASGERFLLRQHRSEHLSLNMLESELLWLSALHRRGLEVQRPVTLRSGTFILLDGERRFSLLSWLEGEVHQDSTRRRDRRRAHCWRGCISRRGRLLPRWALSAPLMVRGIWHGCWTPCAALSA